jgi:hypothetical protein
MYRTKKIGLKTENSNVSPIRLLEPRTNKFNQQIPPGTIARFASPSKRIKASYSHPGIWPSYTNILEQGRFEADVEPTLCPTNVNLPNGGYPSPTPPPYATERDIVAGQNVGWKSELN